jgi:hypothetical protein
MQPSRLVSIASAVIVLTAAGVAAAQDQTPPQRAPEQTRPAPNQDSPAPNSGSSLSNRLSHSHGVIEPPPTGDAGVMSPPDAGTQRTPVIPPPGSSEGDQNVQPK